MSRAQAIADDVDTDMKWWNDYPTSKYMEMARPQSTYNTYMSNVWSKPKRLARSASYTNLTYIREAVHDYPIRRSSSVSSLAPSLALPQHYRQAERFLPSSTVYKPNIYDWYNKPYSVAKWIDTHRSLTKPLYRKSAYEPLPYSSHVPYYQLQTQRIFNNQRLENQRSYISGSQRYLGNYVSARLKADDFAQQYAYTAYEWRVPQDHAFNRHFMYGERVFIPHARGTHTHMRRVRRYGVSTKRPVDSVSLKFSIHQKALCRIHSIPC
uniref:29kDa protein from Anisakis simplex n=1 Tax=Anisakis simplex TaxID=6269 RepID=Q9U5Z9_ANISI|nr:29kDa protein from Anisakis simplex [Anisakis simplex]